MRKEEKNRGAGNESSTWSSSAEGGPGMSVKLATYTLKNESWRKQWGK